MSELTLTLLRLGFLALLWLLVLSVVAVLRRDLFNSAGPPAAPRWPEPRPRCRGEAGEDSNTSKNRRFRHNLS